MTVMVMVLEVVTVQEETSNVDVLRFFDDSLDLILEEMVKFEIVCSRKVGNQRTAKQQ